MRRSGGKAGNRGRGRLSGCSAPARGRPGEGRGSKGGGGARRSAPCAEGQPRPPAASLGESPASGGRMFAVTPGLCFPWFGPARVPRGAPAPGEVCLGAPGSGPAGAPPVGLFPAAAASSARRVSPGARPCPARALSKP